MSSFSCSRLIVLYAGSVQLHGTHALWTPISGASLQKHSGSDYDWRGAQPPLSPPTATGTACDVTNTNRWLGFPSGQTPQAQLDAFSSKWGMDHQGATSPAGNPMIATFGHCIRPGPVVNGNPALAEQHCGQCGMIKFAKDTIYTLTTGATFKASINLDILVMCLDTATASYEIDRTDFADAITRLGAITQTGDTDAHPLITDIAEADCLSGSIPATSAPTVSPTLAPTLTPTSLPSGVTSSPTSSPTEVVPDGPSCFPGEAVALIEGSGQSRISALRVGDRILAAGRYETVLGIPHQIRGDSSSFLPASHSDGDMRAISNDLAFAASR